MSWVVTFGFVELGPIISLKTVRGEEEMPCFVVFVSRFTLEYAAFILEKKPCKFQPNTRTPHVVRGIVLLSSSRTITVCVFPSTFSAQTLQVARPKDVLRQRTFSIMIEATHTNIIHFFKSSHIELTAA